MQENKDAFVITKKYKIVILWNPEYSITSIILTKDHNEIKLGYYLLFVLSMTYIYYIMLSRLNLFMYAYMYVYMCCVYACMYLLNKIIYNQRASLTLSIRGAKKGGVVAVAPPPPDFEKSYCLIAHIYRTFFYRLAYKF